jgi:hypothetical protein
MTTQRSPDVCARALVVVVHGKALALICEVDERIGTSIGDHGVHPDGFAFGNEIHSDLDDGLWVVNLGWEDVGASDWGPHIREFGLAIHSARMATAEEWASHLAGEWPWEPAPEWRVEEEPF